MSQHYQLTIYQQGKLLGHFQSQSLHALMKINTLLSYLQHTTELSYELHQVIEDARFLMQKEGAMQRLGTAYVYKPCSMNILSQEIT
ncbi:hypothetical protein [Acinetobacter nematophilus]|uniref:Uncharacterized protein n=1 Tax=Acinetobacter nematophilus TaxID=2994642 RepID=A0A9X3DVR4_9GAMM|nr:hypothetical protein [Acinetobacter nematophilus]MCX5468978.1 hypothetical protein [Acinetobacter nematophilus]